MAQIRRTISEIISAKRSRDLLLEVGDEVGVRGQLAPLQQEEQVVVHLLFFCFGFNFCFIVSDILVYCFGFSFQVVEDVASRVSGVGVGGWGLGLRESAAHRDKSREWNVSKQKWNLC